jgi:hypothetical protein
MMLEWKIIRSSTFWAALSYALALVVVALNMESWGFVDELNIRHIKGLYEIGFSLFAIFLFSQLFAEEVEERVWSWLFSLGTKRWVYFCKRWLLGMTVLLSVYFISLWIIDTFAIGIPWKDFALYVLPPSVFLGHLALLIIIATRHVLAGIGVPLFYWFLENLTQGMLTRKMSLFFATFPVPNVDMDWNRTGIGLAAAIFGVLAVWRIAKTRMGG